MKEKLNNQPSINEHIRLIGPRASGKTSYLLALSIWNQQKSKTPIVIYNTCVDGQRLSVAAEKILSQGLEFTKTEFKNGIDEIPFYSFKISIIKKKLLSFKKVNLSLDVNIRNYPGEFFDGFGNYNSSIYEDYLTDFTYAGKYLFLIDGASQAMDTANSESLKKLLGDITEFWRNNQFKKWRFAFALSKCEFPDVYVDRGDPRGIVARRFPKMQKVLETWAAQGYGEVEYFTTSTFGVFEEYLEPNSIILQRGKWETITVIKNPSEWKPFGLVEPLYWLCTGKHL
jgi:hypothetical protein